MMGFSPIYPQNLSHMVPQVTAKNREEENKRNALLMGEIASLKAKMDKADLEEQARGTPKETPKDTTQEATNGDDTLKIQLETALQRVEKMEKALEKAKSKRGSKKPPTSSDDESGSDDSDEDDAKEMTTLDGQTAPQMQPKVSS